MISPGAMDTGCPFAQEGISTSVYMGSPVGICPSDEVLVVDTQTRHKMPGEAYQITQSLLRRLAPQYDSIILKRIQPSGVMYPRFLPRRSILWGFPSILFHPIRR